MALKKNHLLDGTMHMDMYIRFDNILFEGKEESGNRMANGILLGYESKESADAGDRPICYFEVKFVYDLSSSDNLWTQAYLAAKATQEFKEAVDC